MIREIKNEDLTREYFALLDQLSPYPPDSSDFVFNNKALYNFGLYQRNFNHIILVALYDGIIVGTGAILIEYKIMGKVCAHIEDVVVDNIPKPPTDKNPLRDNVSIELSYINRIKIKVC